MIGSLQGTIEFLDISSIIINVQSVGYRVTVPKSSFETYHLGEVIKVFTYLHVREDMLELYGFENMEELKLFEALISVSGIGPKTAIGVFSVGSGVEIIAAIQQADVKFFTGVPRLGTKNAQKIIIELKNKVGSLKELDLLGREQGENKEVFEALKAFGFSQKEILQALEAVSEKAASTSTKIKLALKYLGK